MLRGLKRVSCLWALALVVAVEATPEAVEMLLARGNGEKEVWIANVFYSCSQGNAFAMVRNGMPEEGTEGYDVVDIDQLRVYVSKEMKFENDTPKIVVFPRKTGKRDVGVPNVVE
ncbi:MAG: hypothetical protein LBJ22_04990 [Synergistaceae bacterium]|jgi:hypothetical protein|nr:hypothetical protein [Synergistaceae bacterium]